MISRDRLQSDEEKLDEAARYTNSLRRAERLGLYAAIVAGAATAYYVYIYLGRDHDWVGEYVIPLLSVVLGAAFVTRHITTVLAYRANGVDASFFPSKRAPSTAPNDVREWPPDVVVPRLDPSAKSRGASLLTSPLLEGPSVFVAPGGRPTTAVDRLPVGVAAMTEAGFVFYPNADAQALKELNSVGWELAKEAFKPLGVLAALGVGEGHESEMLSLPDWMARSRAHPEFFCFAWSELVEAHWLGGRGAVKLVHEAADVPRAEHVVVTNDSKWPMLLMSMRLRQEMAQALVKRIKEPKAEELAPALLEQFRGVYGDRVGDHTAELYAELNNRVNQAVSAMSDQLDGIAREELAPVLPHFGKYPRIVEQYSLLFPERSGASKP